MSNVQKITDIQSSLGTAFKAVLIDINADQSSAGNEFVNQFSSFLLIPQPSVQDLINLEEVVYNYKLQLEDSIKLNFVSDYLLLKVKAAIKEIKIGYDNLRYNLGHENVNYFPQMQNFYLFQGQIAVLSGADLNVANIANIIINNFSTDIAQETLDDLILDLYYYLYVNYKTISDLQNSLMNIDNKHLAAILNGIYEVLNYTSISTSPIAKAALASLKQYLIDNPNKTNADIIQSISIDIDPLGSSLEDVRSYAVAICNNIGCSDNQQLIDLLEVNIKILVTNNSFSFLRKNLIDYLSECEADNNPYALVAAIIKEIGGDFFANSGPYTLFLTVSDYLSQNQELNINDLVSRVKTSYGEMQGAITYEMLGYDTANLFLTSQVTDLATKLMLDLYTSGVPADEIASGIIAENNFIIKSDLNTAKFVADFYSQATNFIGFGASNKALVSLVEAIDNYHEESNKDFATIIGEITYSIENSEQAITILQLMEAITDIMGSNDLLARYMEVDYNKNYPQDVQANNVDNARLRIFYDIAGDNALLVAASLYSTNILASDYIRNNDVIYNIIDNQYYNNYDPYPVPVNTLTSVFGYLDITPRNGIYLNKCIKTDRDSFLVMGSVFSQFDEEGEGPLLENIEALHTVTGILNGIAQCHQWALTGSANNLYITTNNTAGMAGSSEDTGCIPALIPDIAIAYCWSMFDSIMAV